MPSSATGTIPMLVKVSAICGAVPINTLPNPRRVAESESSGTELKVATPARLTTEGSVSANVRTGSVPVRTPTAVGWKKSNGEQSALEGIVVQVSDIENSPVTLSSVIDATSAGPLVLV